MKGFIIYSTYKVIKDKSYVMLYGRLENGQSFLTINEFKPYFFIRTKDLKKVKRINDEYIYEETKLTNFQGSLMTKVVVNSPKDVPPLRTEFEKAKIKTYESDIRFPVRFLIDNKIQGSLNIEGDYEANHETVDRVYKEPELKPIKYLPNNLKVLSLDIESDKKRKKIYCVSLYSKNSKKTFLNSKKKLKDAVSCEDEEDLLEKLKQEMIDADPDIITGWNVIDFDLNFLKEKYKEYKIPFNLGRDNSQSKLRIESNFFRASRADISGRVVLDGLELIQSPSRANPFIRMEDYKLETVARKILGKSKLITSVGKEKYEEIDRLYKEDQKKLVEYNLFDAELAYKVVTEGNLIDLTIQRSLLTGMQLDRVNASIASLDFLYLQKAKDRNLVCPTNLGNDRETKIKGGYVMGSIPGIYDNIIVLDFKSLYPSIIQTFNIDPSAYLENKKKGAIESPNKAYFDSEKEGILPEIINDLWEAREKVRKEKNELARYSIKILMNSLFGVLANPTCRFYNLKIANAITHFGQEIIKLTAKKIEEMGYEVIYQDTDSSFVNTKQPSSKKAEEIGNKIEKEIDSFYNKYIKEKYKRKSYFDLEYEKCYIRFLMPKLRHSEEGAKKRYAGLLIKNGKEKIEFIGLEFIRCFIPQNTIPLVNGTKKLNELHIDDRIYSLDLNKNRLEAVSPKNFFEYEYNGDIINICVEGGNKFKVTPNHSFFVLVPSAKRSRSDKGFCGYKSGVIKEKLASELKKGDYLISVGNLDSFNCVDEKINENEILLARFFGYLLGEGRLYERYSRRGLHQRRIAITFGENEKELISDFKYLSKKIFNKEPLIYKERSGKKCISLYFDINKELFNKIKDSLILNNHGDRYIRTLAKTHKIPKFILSGSKKTITSFLQAYFDSEGTVGRQIIVSTISKDLSEGVCYLLRKVGIQYSISFKKPNKKHRIINKAYCISIGLNGFEQFSKEIGFKLDYKQKRLIKEIKSRNLKRARYIRPLNDNLILRKILSISNEDYSGKVCDIEVDSDNKNYFIDYILTHNSDWTEAAKIFQERLLDRIFHKKEVTDFIRNFVEDIRKGKYDKDLVYRKALRRGLEGYAVNPPHLKAAKKLKKLESNTIEYYITSDGPEPIQAIKHRIDYEHYIKKQIKPIADSILEFYNISFEELLEGKKQTKLFDFR